MVLYASLSLALTLVLLLLSIIFKLAGKLRLTIPAVYFLLVATVLNSWAAAHEKLALTILLGLLGLSVLSWLIALIKAIKEHIEFKQYQELVAYQFSKARERGIPSSSYSIDPDGVLRDKTTRKPVAL